MDLKEKIRSIPDFPEPGILFRDITPVLQDPSALKQAMDEMAQKLASIEFDLIVGPESRGFIFGVPMAYRFGKGFIPIRKAGKLPYKTLSKQYGLEYGTSVIEMHTDAIKPGQRVAIVDDLLATGGTCKALAELVEEVGGVVCGMVFFIELAALGGKRILSGYDVQSLLVY
ncbi:MAG: adenine phosphoribosyltransferase [Clostridiales bacterium]|jgi:adenine phosphoribosyltransferase|nr:adenine phosphoribosyltransferase [Clostridiales bacterium]